VAEVLDEVGAEGDALVVVGTILGVGVGSAGEDGDAVGLVGRGCGLGSGPVDDGHCRERQAEGGHEATGTGAGDDLQTVNLGLAGEQPFSVDGAAVVLCPLVSARVEGRPVERGCLPCLSQIIVAWLRRGRRILLGAGFDWEYTAHRGRLSARLQYGWHTMDRPAMP
jgi:hypothetical protein